MAETPQGSDLSVGMIDVGDGVLIENRLRLGAIIWLEDKLGKSINEYFADIDVNTMRLKELQPLFVALIMQANPEMAEEEATRLSLRIDLTVIGNVLPTVMAIEPKNSPSPEVDLTEAPAAEE